MSANKQQVPKVNMDKGNIEILIVDDEPCICSALDRILSIEGYRVRTALDGETALKLCREKSPDVLLLDLMMPGMDGREVCQRVRESGTATRIIYFTAKADNTDPPGLKQLRNEVDALITKPCSVKTLLSRLQNVLEGTQQINKAVNVNPGVAAGKL
ncbi:MAG TPA: response regulator [Dehalococcoidia bacterium]|nr:response regulator [Dehalococcoidia bacterium]